MSEYNRDDVPDGFYLMGEKLVRVMEQDGMRVVNYLDKDTPVPLHIIRKEVKFVSSPVNSPVADFGLNKEEVDGREQEMTAKLLEVLAKHPSFRVSRGEKIICLSELDGDKRFYFLLKVGLDAVVCPGD
jgi:hypothetical protein